MRAYYSLEHTCRKYFSSPSTLFPSSILSDLGAKCCCSLSRVSTLRGLWSGTSTSSLQLTIKAVMWFLCVCNRQDLDVKAEKIYRRSSHHATMPIFPRRKNNKKMISSYVPHRPSFIYSVVLSKNISWICGRCQILFDKIFILRNVFVTCRYFQIEFRLEFPEKLKEKYEHISQAIRDWMIWQRLEAWTIFFLAKK